MAKKTKKPADAAVLTAKDNKTLKSIRELADGWTIVTKDHSLSAQWEHTVLVTEAGYEVLTTSVGTPAAPRLQ